MATELKYPLINGYDPKTPLSDIKRELFCNEVIMCEGNKAKAWANIYNKGEKIPRNKANYPYIAFKGKQIKARYKYLLDQHLEHVGIDSRHLLMKSAKLIDAAVAKKDIAGFSTMVNTILKLKGEDIVKVAQITKEVKLDAEDIQKVQKIFEDL